MDRVVCLVLAIFLMFFTSCSEELAFEDYLDFSKPLELAIHENNEKTRLTEVKSVMIEVNSEKWKKLLVWFNANRAGWMPSIASHVGNVYVSQADFLLIHTKNSKGAVVKFRDNKGNLKQLVNGINKGELNFLYDLDKND